MKNNATDIIKRLRVYNQWRIGDDCRSFDELGFSTTQITKDINNICDILEGMMGDKLKKVCLIKE